MCLDLWTQNRQYRVCNSSGKGTTATRASEGSNINGVEAEVIAWRVQGLTKEIAATLLPEQLPLFVGKRNGNGLGLVFGNGSFESAEEKRVNSEGAGKRQTLSIHAEESRVKENFNISSDLEDRC